MERVRTRKEIPTMESGCHEYTNKRFLFICEARLVSIHDAKLLPQSRLVTSTLHLLMFLIKPRCRCQHCGVTSEDPDELGNSAGVLCERKKQGSKACATVLPAKFL